MSTPADGVPDALLEVISAWRLVATLLHRDGEVLGIHPNLLSQAVGTRYGFALARPELFEHANFRPLIERLLSADIYLQMTCVAPSRLALALDLLHLNQLSLRPEILTSPSISNEFIRDQVISELYTGAPFARVFFGRLYNVQSDACPLPIDALRAELRKLTQSDIPHLTGELTPTSTLHREGTGEVFIVFADHGPGDEAEWWSSCWERAWQFLQVLRYVKADIVDIDYATVYYSPEWVNDIRRYGVGLAGRPRLDIQTLPYTLDRDDHATAVRYLAAMGLHRRLLEDLKPTLRRAAHTAGNYYEAYHRRDSLPERLISLAIALEALFSPTDKQELDVRISLVTALLLGRDSRDAQLIAPFVRRIYNARSELMHGGKDPFDPARGGRALKEVDLRRLADYVREGILRVLTLHARGECQGDRSVFHKNLEAAILDHGQLERLQRNSDWQAYLREVMPS